MPEPLTINPDEPLNPGLDYVLLREQGVRLIQEMAGGIWTDYNESDPGVTTLEQLCYALTELSYRAEFSVPDLLTDKLDGKIDPHRQALFIPEAIFPCNPLTVNDYRKLLVDRVPAVYNAWLTCVPPEQAGNINGLYDIAVYVPDPKQFLSTAGYRPEGVEPETLACYCAHRNLCEDVREVIILKRLPTVLSADLLIDDTPSPERILAGLLFAVGKFLAPQLQRRSLGELVKAGRPSAEIFDGPLLECGFIADAQLKPKMNSVSVQEIAAVMVRSPGVRSVSSKLCVRVDRGDELVGVCDDTKVSVSDREILELDASAIGGLKLFCSGIRCEPNASRVQRELDNLWRSHRETYNLAQQYEEYFGFPQGQFRDVKSYYSVQNQFPNVYGISEQGLPEGATKARRGQTKQFKAYLLVFEQLMADYFAQLANVKHLYSIEPAKLTYFWQSLAHSVPNVKPLLGRDYQRGLREIVKNQDSCIDRRNRFLDFLLALYAEKLDASSVATVQAGDSADGSGQTLIEAKQQLLNHLVESTHNRGRSFDYLSIDNWPRDVDRNIAGMLIKSRIQLGMPVFSRDCYADLLERLGLRFVADKPDCFVTDAEQIAYIGEHGRTIAPPARDTELSRSEIEQLVRELRLPGDRCLVDDWLWVAGHVEHFRVSGDLGRELSVWCQRPEHGDWCFIGRLEGDLATDECAAEAIHALIALIKWVHRCAREQLYIVEHTLLRPRDKLPSGRQNGFDYSFTITAVVLDHPTDEYWKRFVEDVLRENTPAHIAIDLCFLSPRQMCKFEVLYKHWRAALGGQKERAINRASGKLKIFLAYCYGKGLRASDTPEDSS